MRYTKYLHVFKECGWNVNVMDKEIEIENQSPAGENLVEYFDKKIDLAVQMRDKADSFDAEEHAEMWLEHRGENGVPASIRTLLNDADEVAEMYENLARKLEEKKENAKRRTA